MRGKLFFKITAVIFFTLSSLVFIPENSNARESGSSACFLPNTAFASQKALESAKEYEDFLKNTLGKTAHPEIPSVYTNSIAKSPRIPLSKRDSLPPGMIDPVIEIAREISAFEDFKPLSDAILKPQQTSDWKEFSVKWEQLSKEAFEKKDPNEGIALLQNFVREWVLTRYDISTGEYLAAKVPLGSTWKFRNADKELADTLAYCEKTFPFLFKRSPEEILGSALSLPYPFMIPAGRFNEGYYWDSWVGVLAMLKTGRREVVAMQVENILELIRENGFVPNGWRTYYLSRSQPPFATSMVRALVEDILAKGSSLEIASMKSWLKTRALPLLVKEAEWWQKNRSNQSSNFIVHSDATGKRERLERYGADLELLIGETYVDVKAGAESGRDFQAAHNKRASKVASVLTNSMVVKSHMDLSQMLQLVGESSLAKTYESLAARRKDLMNTYMWNEEKGCYLNYDIETKMQIPILTAENGYALLAQVPNEGRAQKLRDTMMSKLFKNGGLMSSEDTKSTHQWDGNRGWAIDQVAMVLGLEKYGKYKTDEIAISKAWISTLTKIHSKHNALPESADVEKQDLPVEDGTKYPAQLGFLWTNSSLYVLADRLGLVLTSD